MWLASLCVSNQALHDKYVDLNSTGVVLSETITAAMNEGYRMVLILPQTGQRRTWRQFSCPPANGVASGSALSANTPSIKVRLSSDLHGSESHEFFGPECRDPNILETNVLTIGHINISKGTHRLIIENEAAWEIPGGSAVKVLLIGSGSGAVFGSAFVPTSYEAS